MEGEKDLFNDTNNESDIFKFDHEIPEYGNLHNWQMTMSLPDTPRSEENIINTPLFTSQVSCEQGQLTLQTTTTNHDPPTISMVEFNQNDSQGLTSFAHTKGKESSFINHHDLESQIPNDKSLHSYSNEANPNNYYGSSSSPPPVFQHPTRTTLYPQTSSIVEFCLSTEKRGTSVSGGFNSQKQTNPWVDTNDQGGLYNQSLNRSDNPEESSHRTHYDQQQPQQQPTCLPRILPGPKKKETMRKYTFVPRFLGNDFPEPEKNQNLIYPGNTTAYFKDSLSRDESRSKMTPISTGIEHHISNITENPRHQSIKNGVYDPKFKELGLDVDPHLRMFKAWMDKNKKGENNVENN
ncbi:uncharacterized protein LOC113338499 [Papaver somniferum]|uniref:uncharacterized protein LOC113338499 n=1 Tax=Papaver somniferum TaxID=3469 RepID=UPI000E6FA1D1|nr:uncharacterized protein LOC113338499 [Papaver somniferum]